jgi:beta-mannanase
MVMRKPAVLFVLVLLLTLLPVRPAAASGYTLLGVYYGNQGWAMSDVANMQAWQGKGNAAVTLFTNWCSQSKTLSNLFGQQLPNIWANHSVPLITWQPYLCSTSTTPSSIDAQIWQGKYDSYIKTWAADLKTWLAGPDRVYGTADDRRAYVRLAHEMNGNWYPWAPGSGGETPADYVAMWQHTVSLFTAIGLDASHLQWIWAPNATDVGGYTAESEYPGDAWVNWVAVDGYNWGTSQSWSSWQTPAQVFDGMIARLQALTTRPLAITEVASSTATSSGTSVAAKLQWITDFFSYLSLKNVKLVSWFNTDKETDWAVFGGANGDGSYTSGHTTYRTYSTYRTAVGGASVVASDPNNPRLLTDAQFAGQ